MSQNKLLTFYSETFMPTVFILEENALKKCQTPFTAETMQDKEFLFPLIHTSLPQDIMNFD